MTPELITELKNQIDVLEQGISDLKQAVNLLKIHDQYKLDSNDKITPGIASKVAYDEKGLIIKGSQLERSDIPSISIDQVEGLRNLISTKVDSSQFNDTINSIKTLSKSSKPSFTACKINFDDNGFVISGSNLSADDIPTIPIERVDGLADKLQSIIDIKPEVSETKQSVNINAGTYTKVTVNTDGTISNGGKLTLDDIPMELITRINEIESKIPYLASKDIVDAISKEISGKLDLSPSDITPGIYTKIRVNKNGIITKGDQLTINDLPNINIDDITDLDDTLKSKANQEDIIRLNESVNSILNLSSKLTKLTSIENQINNKADSSDVATLISKINFIQTTLDNMNKMGSLDAIVNQINIMQDDINTLSGKVSSIEHHLNITDSFDE